MLSPGVSTESINRNSCLMPYRCSTFFGEVHHLQTRQNGPLRREPTTIQAVFLAICNSFRGIIPGRFQHVVSLNSVTKTVYVIFQRFSVNVSAWCCVPTQGACLGCKFAVYTNAWVTANGHVCLMISQRVTLEKFACSLDSKG